MALLISRDQVVPDTGSIAFHKRGTFLNPIYRNPGAPVEFQVRVIRHNRGSEDKVCSDCPSPLKQGHHPHKKKQPMGLPFLTNTQLTRS